MDAGGRTGLQPLIRANWAKLAISTAKKKTEPERTRVLDALEDVRAEVREAGMLEWQPARVFVQVTEGIQAALGRSGGRQFWRDVMVDAFGRRFLKPLVRGSLAIHGESPGSILRMTPQAYSLSFKNCGVVRLHQTDREGRVRLQFEGLPPVIAGSEATLECFAGNCEAALVYVRAAGTVVRSVDDADHGRVHFTIQWQA